MVQFDHVGDVSPALLIQLQPRERVMTQIDTVRYRDPSVVVDRVKYTYPNPMGGFPRTLRHYFETLDGPGTATVSTGVVGEIKIDSLMPGQMLFLHGSSLLAHEATMGYELATLAVYQLPNIVGTQYIPALKLTGPGAFAYQMHGNALTFHLKPGETVRTEPASLLGLTPGMGLRVQIFGGLPHFPSNHFFPLLDITGPGTVMVHSGRILYQPEGE